MHLPTARLNKVSAGSTVLPPEEREACTAAIRGVLSQDNCSQLVWMLITQFLPLDEGYLQEWAADPEPAIAEESASELLELGYGHTGANSDAEEMDARTAAMALLLALSSAFPEVVVPILAEGLQKVVSTPMAPLETEAWITVAGIGVPAMASAGFDVGGWVAAMLVSPAVAAPDGYAPEPFEAGAPMMRLTEFNSASTGILALLQIFQHSLFALAPGDSLCVATGARHCSFIDSGSTCKLVHWTTGQAGAIRVSVPDFYWRASSTLWGRGGCVASLDGAWWRPCCPVHCGSQPTQDCNQTARLSSC